MLPEFALALFTLVPAVSQEGGDPAQADAAAERVQAALERGELAERIAAIRAAAEVADAEVIEAIAKGLRDDTSEVKLAVLETLGSMRQPDALEALAKVYKRDRDLREAPEVYEAMVLAIARHANPQSVGLLTDFSSRRLDEKVVRARILGLARIRDRAALAGLFAMMAKLGDEKLAPYMDDFRTALIVLAGADHGGESRAAWLRWWEPKARTFVVAPEPPTLPAHVHAAWTRYWETRDHGALPGGR